MTTPDDNLPPVQPPSAGFLMQLFVVPLLIVGVIVLICLMLSWLTNLGSKPQELVTDLKKLNAGSWQKALTVANLLTDRRHDELRRDPKMAQQLSGILDEQLRDSSRDPDRVKLRVYLCLALGVFEIEDGLPTLIDAARKEQDPVDLEVRKTAIEAITRRADVSEAMRNSLRDNDSLWQALTEAANARSDDPNLAPQYAQLRARAAYASGVLGGERGIEMLATMLADSDASVRYNAATGLARHGDARCVPRIVEMLEIADPAPTTDAQPTNAESSTPGIIEQTSILGNGLRASVQLAKQSPTANLTPVREAIERLSSNKSLSTIVHRGIEADLHTAAAQFGIAP